MLLLLFLFSGVECQRRKRRKISHGHVRTTRTIEPLDDDEEPDSDDDVFTPAATPRRTTPIPAATSPPSPTAMPTASPSVTSPRTPVPSSAAVNNFIRIARIKYITPPFVSSNDPTPVIIEFESAMPSDGDATLQIDSHRVICARMSTTQIECNVTKHRPGEVFVTVDFGNGRITDSYPILYVGGVYLRTAQLVKASLAIIVVVTGFIAVIYLCRMGNRGKDKQSGVPADPPEGKKKGIVWRRP